jgi:hypothetical protein
LLQRRCSFDIISGGQCSPRVGTCAPDAIH